VAFHPNFQITPETAKALMSIEASRATADRLPMSPQLIVSLRESARLLSTHYSTQIEGNLLTAAQVEKVMAGQGGFPGRERDEIEVRNYYRGVEKVDALAALTRPIEEKDIQLLHGLVLLGKPKPTPYRDGQNVIRNSLGGGIVYMPPEARDVPALMRDLIRWMNKEIKVKNLPVPVLAGLAHYQFATIHPYFDGNGRTARLLTSLILHRCGYGLKGIYSLEEYYARNLSGYYAALKAGDSHNYYMGREKADVSPFVEYFCRGMANAFAKVCARAESLGVSSRHANKEALLRELRPLQRQALGLFLKSKVVTATELATYLGLSPRQARELCGKWIEGGFLVVENSSKKARSYRMAERFEKGLV